MFGVSLSCYMYNMPLNRTTILNNEIQGGIHIETDLDFYIVQYSFKLILPFIDDIK
jgi:hypothetical protein